MAYFPDISLLITHYNRSESLGNLLASLNALNCRFGEIVVSDDGSMEEHQHRLTKLQEKYEFRLIITPVNKGLGHNINKGQDAVCKDYTLYIQEDFEPSTKFPYKLMEALKHMKTDLQLDLVKFYAYYPYPYLQSFDENFDQMYLPTLGTDYTKIYFYTDHPHLRRSNFFSKFGRYPEGLKGDVTEYKMCISALQNKAKGLFYKDYSRLLLQKNSEQEPSTMSRSSWKKSDNLVIKIIRHIYRQIKYNIDIYTQAPLKKY